MHALLHRIIACCGSELDSNCWALQGPHGAGLKGKARLHILLPPHQARLPVRDQAHEHAASPTHNFLPELKR